MRITLLTAMVIYSMYHVKREFELKNLKKWRIMKRLILSLFIANIVLVYSVQANSLPAGSYQATCKLCTYPGRSLTCFCKTISGIYKPTNLSVLSDFVAGRDDIINYNGDLVYSGRR